MPFLWMMMAVKAVLAGSFAERPFETTVDTAAAIVRGHVGAVNRTEWGESATGSRAIYTYTEFQVADWIKGASSANRILVRQLGGEKDGQAMQVPGVPTLQSGEELVLFLRPVNADQSFDIQGMSMGRYELQKGPDGEEFLQGAGANSLQPRSISALRTLIKAQADANGTKTPAHALQLNQKSGEGPHLETESAPSGIATDASSTGEGESVETSSQTTTRRVIVILLGILAALGFIWFRRK